MTGDRPGPLAGVRVLDLTQYVSGPFCTMLLADMGAEVIKVELPPQGDVYRATGPAFVDGEGTVFLSLNRNKKSLALDYKRPDGRAAMHRLLTRADVVVENARPGAMARAGLDYAAARATNPALVYCSISGFGQTGPRRLEGGFDLIVQGLAGLMAVTGEADGPPVKMGLPVLDMGAAMFAVQGILGALLVRRETGQGQYVETSLWDCALAWHAMGITNYHASGSVPGRHGSASPYFAPYEAFRTRDGYLTVAGAPSQEMWRRFCAAIGAEALVEDPRFLTNADRVAHRAELAHRIEAILAARDAAEWMEELRRAGVPAGPIRALDAVLADAQVAARELMVTARTSAGSEVAFAGAPVKLSGTPWRLCTAPPRLGEHGRDVLAAAGFAADEIAALEASGTLVEPGQRNAA